MAQGQSINKVLIFISGVISGVFVSSFIFISPVVTLFIICLGIFIALAEKILHKSIGKEVLILSLIIISFGLGALRYSIKDFHEKIEPSLSGIVINEPEQKENTTRFVMKSDNGEKLLVSTDLFSHAAYGDQVEVSGKLEEPGIIDDGVGRPFDYAKYLAKDDIYYTLNFAKVEIVSNRNGNKIKHLLFDIKSSFVSKVREILVEPESSLLAGLIVAGKGAMPKNILEEFRRAGVVHIVVLSGYNITIIAEFMRKSLENILIWTRAGALPQVSAFGSIVGILLFVLMTGAEATVVRAALMVLVVIGAKMFGRNYSASRALIGAAFVMVALNPKILVFDPSFQLSFIATAALIYISPIVSKYLEWVSDKYGFRTILATTLATQIAVLPYLIYSMGSVSLVSLPANLLILVFVPFTMLAGFVATLVAYVSHIIALPFTYVTHLLLSWILGVSHYLGNLSFASVSINPPLWLVVLIYIALITTVWRLRNSAPRSAS